MVRGAKSEKGAQRRSLRLSGAFNENRTVTAKAAGNRYRATLQMISAKSEVRHGRDR